MNKIASFIKDKRRETGLTQEEFALRSGLGLSFVRKLEQGKDKLKLDKVNQALKMFGMEAVPGRIDRTVSQTTTTNNTDHTTPKTTQSAPDRTAQSPQPNTKDS